VTGIFRSEILKQRTTRTNALLLAWMIGVVAFAVLLHVFGFSAAKLAQHGNQMKVLGVGTTIGALFASFWGAISITGEIRHGLIRPTFLATPQRSRVIVAKAAVSALAGLGVGFVAEGLAAGLLSAGVGIRGIPNVLSAGDYAQLIAGGALAAALFGAIGVGVGAVVRNQVATVVGFCVWLLFVEGLLLGDVPSVAKFAPGASAGAIAGAIQDSISSSLVAPGIGILLLAAYAIAASGIGSLAITRRDVG
jgi:ABC-2 type transport system permease protein